MNLVQRIPLNIRMTMAAQIKKAVNTSARHFSANAANERSLTGALVMKLEEEVLGQAGQWQWSARAVTLSEQPKGVGEDALGADFVVQVDVYESGINTAQKMVPIQGKNRWAGHDRDLEDQARKLIAFPGGGLIADYGPGSYLAVRAEAAFAAKGRRNMVSRDAFRDLGDALGDDFLECRVGTDQAYVTSNNAEVVFTGALESREPIPLLADHVLRLKVKTAKRLRQD